jgi:ribosomal-protein-alanine N-acetyltransferase
MIKKKFPNVEHRNIRLREFNQEHLTTDYIAWLNNKNITRYSEQRHVDHTLESAEKYYKNNLLSENYFLAIEVMDGKNWAHVGNIGAQIDIHNLIANLAILIGNTKFHQKGIGSMAWALAAKSVIKIHDLRLITAGTMSLNLPMLGIFRTTNMTIDAVLRSRFMIGGGYADLVIASGTEKSFSCYLNNT